MKLAAALALHSSYIPNHGDLIFVVGVSQHSFEVFSSPFCCSGQLSWFGSPALPKRKKKLMHSCNLFCNLFHIEAERDLPILILHN